MSKKENVLNKIVNKRISRRSFLKASAIAGGVAASSGLLFSQTALAESYGQFLPESVASGSVKYRRSACFGCAFGCGNQVRIETIGGVETATKLDGNPYDIVVNDIPSIAGSYVAPSDVSNPAQNPGRLCAKGNAQLKDVYDPYRVMTPLKRAGKRGEGKWTSISWATAINEIVSGGYLPGNAGIPYAFEGLAGIRGDGSAMGSGHPDIHPDFRTSTAAGALLIQGQGKGMRTLWIDGRNQQGEFAAGTAQARFGNAMGIQRHYHDSICNGSWKAAWDKQFSQYKFRPDYHAQNPTYIIYGGCNPMEADQAVNHAGRRLTDALAAGSKLIVVDPRLSVTAAKANTWAVSGGNAGSKWVRIKQSGDGAFAMAMIKRWFATGALSTSGSTADYLCRTKIPADSAFLNYSNTAYLVENVTTAYPYGKLSANVVSLGTGTVVAGSTVNAGELDPAGYPNGTYQGTVYQLLKARVQSGSFSDANIEAATGLAIADINQIADDFWAAAYPVAMPYRGVFTSSQGYYASQAWGMLNVLRNRMDQPGGLASMATVYGLATPSVNAGVTNPSGSKSEYYSGSYGPSTGTAANNLKAFFEANPPRRAWYFAFKMPEAEILPRESIGYPWRIKANMFYVSNHAYNTQTGKYDASDALKKADGDGYYVPLNVSITTTMNETAELCDYILPDTTWAERWSAPTGTYGGVPVYRGTLRRPVVGGYVPVIIKDNDGSNSRNTYWYKGVGSGIAPGTYSGVDALGNAISGPQTSEDILILIGRKMRELYPASTNFKAFGYQGGSLGATANYDSSYDQAQAQISGAAIIGSIALPAESSVGANDRLMQVLNDVDANDGTSCPWTDTNIRYYIWMGGRRQNPNNANMLDSVNSAYMKNRLTPPYKVWIESYEGMALLAQKPDGSLYERYFDQLPPTTVGTFGSGLDLAKGVLSVNGTDLDSVDLAAGYTYTVTNNKLAYHAQSRTSSNEWLRELEPSNFVNMPKAGSDSGGDYALASNGSTKIYDGDTVKLEANYKDSSGSNASQTGIAKVTGVLASDIIHISHHFGRWAMGSKGFKVDNKDSTNGLTTAATYDAQGNITGGTRGANFDGKMDLSSGVGINALGRREPYHESKGGGGLNSIAGGHVFYGTRVKVTKL